MSICGPPGPQGAAAPAASNVVALLLVVVLLLLLLLLLADLKSVYSRCNAPMQAMQRAGVRPPTGVKPPGTSIK